MLIPINISSSSTLPLPPQLAKLGNDELVLIELQGTLDVECTASSDRDGQMVGKFKLEEGSIKPTLSIGHHLLEGKIVSLPKPLGVLQRCGLPFASQPIANDNAAEDDAMDGGTMKQPNKEPANWDMVAIVKKKIVFSKRPLPIVGSTASTLGTSGKG